MGLFKNCHLKTIDPQCVNNFDDITIILENCSHTYRKYLVQIFEYSQRICDGVWKDITPGAKKIARDLDCSTKTIYRANRDLRCVIKTKRRFRKGKQTSNQYFLLKPFLRYMKAFKRLGLFKKDVDFFQRLKWIHKLWVESGCEEVRFMNKIYNYNSINPKRLRPCYEHGQKKMSHGDYAKCPTTSNSLSLNLDIGTVRVPESDRRKMESFLQQKVNHAMQDMKWYSVDIGKTIMNPVGFFKNALKRDLLRTTA